MKATLEIPDDLYRRVKARAAIEGRPVREVAIELFRSWLEDTGLEAHADASKESSTEIPVWYGALRRFADNAVGKHDMDAVRASIERGRAHVRKSRS